MFSRASNQLIKRAGSSLWQSQLPCAARSFASKVTFVKKIYADGSTCQKCDFVWKQIEKDGLTEKIDRTVVADERDMSCEGIVLARKHNVTRAPFFVVTDDAKPDVEKVYDVYFKLKKDVFAQESGEAEKNEEIIRGMMKQVF
eukprot:gb/GFBE01019396.1/.p1 GENE.gb/GFBE01019396.1/~~gb/GFBE01019396.1/.p1  ORF type:complete len:143 (+),score=54.52 gb/GFBE01019396.1/:1-429(+)